MKKTSTKISHKSESEEEQIPSFLQKTYDMLEDGNYSTCISWTEDGLSIAIHNAVEFAQKILPAFFKHNNLASFIRQLNMYEFKKKKGKLSDHVFTHECFQCGRRDLLKLIKRKSAKGSLVVRKVSSERSPVENECSYLDESLALATENSVLKKAQVESTERIKFLEKSLIEMNQKNQEIAQQSHAAKKSEALLKLVIEQVACLYGPGTIQNILQGVRNRMGEALNPPIPDSQQYQQPLRPQQQIMQPFYGNQPTSWSAYKQTTNSFDQVPFNEEPREQSQQDSYINANDKDLYQVPVYYRKLTSHSDEKPTQDQEEHYKYLSNQKSDFGFPQSRNEQFSTSQQQYNPTYEPYNLTYQPKAFPSILKATSKDQSSFIGTDSSEDVRSFSNYF